MPGLLKAETRTGREPQGWDPEAAAGKCRDHHRVKVIYPTRSLPPDSRKAGERLGGPAFEVDWASCGLGIWHKLKGQGLKYARNSAEGNKQSQDEG